MRRDRGVAPLFEDSMDGVDTDDFLGEFVATG